MMAAFKVILVLFLWFLECLLVGSNIPFTLVGFFIILLNGFFVYWVIYKFGDDVRKWILK